MRRKIILLSIFFLLFSFIGMFGVKKIVHAQTKTTKQSITKDATDKHIEAVKSKQTNLDQFQSLFTGSLMSDFIVMLTGGCESDCPSPQLKAGAIPSVGNAISSMYKEKPAETSLYIADLMQSAGVVQPAYAQGLGFSSLRPILEVWKAFRNIAYVMFVLIFLIIGFAIMFRQKIGSQAEVTIQQAIPKIVVALLAVTFSYAIAGLLIDLMYVFMYFVVVVFAQSGLVKADFVSVAPNSPNSILSKNIFQVGGEIISSGFPFQASATVGGLIDSALGGGLGGNIVGSFSSVLVALVLLISVLFAVFKTLIALIKVYFEIIMNIIFAPLILMMGAINSGVFVNWIKGLAANLMVFPALLLFIMIAYMFMGLSGYDSVANQFNQGGFLPPFIPGRGDPKNIALIAGIGAMFLMAEVPNIMGKFKPKSIFEEYLGTAWGNAKAGWSGNNYIPGIANAPGKVVNAVPFGVGSGMPYRTEGKETGLERVLIGSRAFRKRELELQEQARIWGKPFQMQYGGLLGMRRNVPGARRSAQQQVGGGAGAQSEENA